MTLTVAFAVVCASTALFPPFSGSVWFTAGIGAAITVAAVGTLSRLRTLPPVICLLISLAGLFLYLNLAFEAHVSFGWIVPTRASLIGLGDLVRNGFADAHTYSPPAATVPPLVFLATAGIGITAVLTDLIAVRLRSTAMAGLPLLVLFTVPETINVQRSALTTCLIFIISTGGYLAMLSIDGREQIRVWGRLVSLWRTETPDPAAAAPAANGADPDDGPGGGSGAKHRQRPAISPFRGPDTRSLAAAGRRVGFASIVLALCAPLLVPGLHAARVASDNLVFGGTGGSGGGAAIPPLLSEISAELEDSHPHVVMDYVTNDPHPGYLQQEVRDTLTANGGWEEPFRTQAITLYPMPSELQPQAPGLASVGSPVTTTITVVKGGSSPTPTFNLLPTPFPPTRVSPPAGTWLYDPGTLMVGTESASMDDVTYTVQSREVYPAKTQLEKAPPPTGMSQYLQLPASFSQSAALLKLARTITKGDASNFDKAYSIQEWLGSTGGFTYNTAAPEVDNIGELLAYLQNTKSGDCVQSAFAMAALLRVLGIPSRLVLGFTQGTETTPGHYEVKDTDAHAWPEAFFSGFGWIQFEPVAPGGGGTAQGGGFSSTQASTGGNTPPTLAAPTQSAGSGSTVNRRHLIRPGIGGEPGVVSILPLTKPAAKTPWTALALAILAALALACGIIAMVAPLGHRALAGRQDDRGRRRRRNASPLLLIVIGGGVVAFALDRVITRTSGLNVGSGWATVGIAFGIAFGVVCLAAVTVPAACRAVLRRARWMRAADDADRAHTAWLELRADLADYGLAPLPSESPRALAGRVTTGLALAEPAVEAVTRIAMAEERASYSGRPAESETLHQDSVAARRGIAGAAGRGARWRARIFPASMLATFADAAGRIPQIWAAWRVRLPLASPRR